MTMQAHDTLKYQADYLRRCRNALDAALSRIPAYAEWHDVGGDDPFARLAALPPSLIRGSISRQPSPAGRWRSSIPAAARATA